MPTPPTIDRNLLQRLAELGRLHLPPERQANVLQQLQRIVDAFDALRDLPTKDTPPCSDPQHGLGGLRPDVAEAPLPLEQVLANAPQGAGGMFVVPRVVEA